MLSACEYFAENCTQVQLTNKHDYRYTKVESTSCVKLAGPNGRDCLTRNFAQAGHTYALYRRKQERYCLFRHG